MGRESKGTTVNYHAVNDDLAGESQPPLSPKPLHTRRTFLTFWLWELLATVASFACLVAIVIILVRMHAQPLSRWSLSISLNATIAVFITAAKSLALLVIAACIAQAKWIRFRASARKLQELDLFENAARGPLGSLMLLFSVRWGAGIAGFGAIATILALGVDSFAQQVVRLETRDVQSLTNDGTFGLSHGYNGSAKWMIPMPVDVDDETVDVAMEGAIFQGIYSKALGPDFTCNSNCIWKDSYISAGFVSRCENVTVQTLARNKNVTSLAAPSNARAYNVSTPGGVVIGVTIDTLFRTQISVAAKVTRPNAYTPETKLVPEGSEFSPEFIKVGVLRRRPDLPWGGSFNEDASPNVYFPEVEFTECSIRLVAHNYTSLSASGNALSLQATQIPLEPGVMLKPNSYYFWEVLFNQTGLPPFRLLSADLVALANLFESKRFSGEMTIGQIRKKSAEGVVMALLKSNISEAFDNMAASMTEQLRARPDRVAQGVSVSPVVFVHIRWAWLALPVGVTVVAALFLLLTIINSYTHGCEPWKSSVIALLFHSVVKQTEEQTVLRSEMKTLAEMERRAKKTNAMLE
ncbi:hypothetical protein NX059_009449 [Plenodomus lindquistii]|nr:hypothetical protein NX059_009449 [Plenodomus lindquistii]